MMIASIIFPKRTHDKKQIITRKFVASQIKHHRSLAKSGYQNKSETYFALLARLDGIWFTLKAVDDNTLKAVDDNNSENELFPGTLAKLRRLTMNRD